MRVSAWANLPRDGSYQRALSPRGCFAIIHQAEGVHHAALAGVGVVGRRAAPGVAHLSPGGIAHFGEFVPVGVGHQAGGAGFDLSPGPFPTREGESGSGKTPDSPFRIGRGLGGRSGSTHPLAPSLQGRGTWRWRGRQTPPARLEGAALSPSKRARGSRFDVCPEQRRRVVGERVAQGRRPL